MDQQEYKKRLDNIVREAKAGNSDAQYALAVLSSNQDIDISLGWMYKAISAGHVGAIFTLGAWCIQGTLFDPDLEKGHALLKRACDKKHFDAYILRAALYAHGFGVERDWGKALALTLEVAKKGYARAIGNLAFLCIMAGEKEEGEKLLRAATDAIDPIAMYTYGKHILAGEPGEQDRQKALQFIAIAAKAGKHPLALEFPGISAVDVPEKLSAPTDFYKSIDWGKVEGVLQLPPVPRTPKINQVSESPSIATLPGFLSEDECDYMVASAARHLMPSQVIDPISGKQIKHEYRSSSDMRFWHAFQDLVIYCFLLRISQATELPLENHEMLGVLKYEPGQQYKPHGDFLTPDEQGRNPEVDRSGQRVKTLLVYLNDGFEGGETEFVNIGLKIKGAKGEGLLFVNTLEGGVPDKGTIHAGLPITKGIKWLSTIWIREKEYKVRD